MKTYDIRKKFSSSFSEPELNDLLQELWENQEVPDKIICTMAQKRNIGKFSLPVALPRTFIDRLLFRTRYTDGSLKWQGYEKSTVQIYESDFGYIRIEPKR